MQDISNELEIKASMIELGEQIAWGSDSALMREAASKMRELQLNADRWQALIDCARIRVLGSAGLVEEKDNGYAHIGLELWTHHDGKSLPSAIEDITKFADKAIKANKEHLKL